MLLYRNNELKMITFYLKKLSYYPLFINYKINAVNNLAFKGFDAIL